MSTVYALSAANATQSSYACYMDQKLGTFLGDVFSIKWMEDTDRVRAKDPDNSGFLQRRGESLLFELTCLFIHV